MLNVRLPLVRLGELHRVPATARPPANYREAKGCYRRCQRFKSTRRDRRAKRARPAMSWSIGGPDERGRWVGYGVPAYCDHPKCNAEIDRGLSYVCGGEPYGGEFGCGLYFCGKHLTSTATKDQVCPRCAASRPSPYAKIKPEHPDWIHHLLIDESWAEWRAENPGEVKRLSALIPAKSAVSALG